MYSWVIHINRSYWVRIFRLVFWVAILGSQIRDDRVRIRWKDLIKIQHRPHPASASVCIKTIFNSPFEMNECFRSWTHIFNEPHNRSEKPFPFKNKNCEKISTWNEENPSHSSIPKANTTKKAKKIPKEVIHIVWLMDVV